ncbi:ATP-binding protein [Pantoea sp. FN0302]|uniref:ATP-binding protein n=1 Tax=unclassified Pantoea TaxID=2630326 RepID=UPI003CF504F5
MAQAGIRYQLFILTTKVALSTIVLLSAVYSIYIYFFSDLGDRYSWIPSTHDWALTVIAGLFSSAIALFFAWRFARKIILPLNALAYSARRIAEGRLDERAVHNMHEIREAGLMIDDFNLMADKLEVMSNDMKKWNAAIAHELRTPVTVLKGRIQGMSEGIFDTEKKQFDILLRQTEALSRLIDDLRVLSLSDSGQLYLYKETLHLQEVIIYCVEAFRDKLSAHGIEPVIEAEEVICFADEIRIRQILSALLSNVCKYASPGVVMVTCRAENHQIVLTVEDEGPGISDNERGSVFEAFFRAEKDRILKPDGTGLGLAVVYAIARAHGGKAACRRSNLGGTCIEVVFTGNTEN